MFDSADASIEFETRGPKSGVKPRAQGGDVIHMTADELRVHGSVGDLGKFEPVDAEAIQAYGNTRPIISRLISHPATFVQAMENRSER